VHRLEDGQEIGMHCDQSELGKAVDLGYGTGVFRIVVERFFLFHIFFIFFMIFFHIFFISLIIFFEPPLGLGLVHRGRCTLKWG
jgi:hypothetical protein